MGPGTDRARRRAENCRRFESLARPVLLSREITKLLHSELSRVGFMTNASIVKEFVGFRLPS